ncbi:RNA methyltransferase, TrmH family, group 3 [Phytophthora nicotianae]|uniref:rRNA methyltransferase 1, mitochondrial n=2 Tax=Phytophthora nicotianae TaxID=4792 RepID=W2R7R9_PHYN3|nr:RNA methyltransferase, TrmH family, group 3 [Phytophthora nicotianae INRA-310]ETL87901.1 RNA methyltransferase, TrmH family, group 3 [Phytophthora nicotianae]ETN20570.1 RNA methyltransferase, TrmH family, group 3 [Phytophthora nicotianae INRA-310]
MLRTSALLSRGAASTLPRLLSVCLFSTDGQWQSPSRSRGAKPSRWGPPRGRGGGRKRDNERPPLTRTNDGKDVPQLAGEGVYGIHSVLQALESGHRDTHALYVREERSLLDGQRPKKKSAADVRALERIHELAEANGIQIHSTSKWMLNHITGDKPHQGVVLDAAPIQLKEFVPAEPSGWRGMVIVWFILLLLILFTVAEFTESERSPVILVLDEIHDPQNFGAILRSAHFLGCSAVVVSDRNTAPLSPAVSRASVGALEVMVANDKLMKARNLHEMLAISGDLGWRVVGASSGPNSITSTKLSDGQPTILVMGNEHRGLRKHIRQCCQDVVIIPGQATDEDTRVDSLNVSVASAILLYELLHH